MEPSVSKSAEAQTIRPSGTGTADIPTQPAPIKPDPESRAQSCETWDPRAPEVLADQYSAYDRMRRRCAIAYSEYLQYSVFRHADVTRILADPATFSSKASAHVSVPNSMDPPQHGAYRRIIDGYFGEEAMARFAPDCRALCHELVERLLADGECEVMTALAYPFAIGAQCAFMGWSAALQASLREWIAKKNAATLSGDTAANAAVALEFDQTIRRQLDLRRQAGAGRAQDVTARLLGETVAGRALHDEEIVSILRNWTVGELATIAASVGIIIHYLAAYPGVQDMLRRDPRLIGAANDEILRIRAPLIANRRVTTRTVRVGGVQLQAGARLTLIWASANRDETVFGDPDEFRLDRDPSLNLLYGAGIHACPGAPLARLELQTIVEALLAGGRRYELAPGTAPAMAHYPIGGFSHVTLRIRR